MRQPVARPLKPTPPPSDRAPVTLRAMRTRSRRGVGLAAAVLALGLAGGTAATTSLALAADDASSAELALRTASVRNALNTTFQRYADTMHDLVAVTGTPSPAATVDRIVGERLDGAHQVLVVGADHSVTARHSVDGSIPAPFATLAPEPELARAMELARRSGRLVTSAAHTLPADADLPPAHRQAAFEMAAPAPDGWVIVSVRATDLLDASLRAAGVTGVSAVLTETGREVAHWSPGGAGRGERGQRLDVPLAGHAWQIEIRPTTALIGAGRAAAAPLTMLGAVLLSVALAAVALAAAAGRLAVAEANTALNQANTALDQANERARRAEDLRRAREAEIAGFATAAGEHLHAPLHTIAGFTDLLIEDVGPRLDPETRGFLDRIGGATKRMLTLVDEMVIYTAADTVLELEPVEASMLALDVAAGRLQTPGDRPSIEIGELPAVTADALLLRQVLDQLVDNAVRYVRPGAPAQITVGAREQDGGRWRFEVADRGIGIPAEQRDRIFQPFHRAPAAEGYPGTGLGLAVCARIVALHGGEIGVEANPGGGSVFWFTVAGVPAPARELALR
jgi:signal transduction histidine kinase